MRTVFLTAALMVSMVSCADNVDDGDALSDDEVQASSAVSRQATLDFASMTGAELAAYVPAPEDFFANSYDECHGSNCSGVVACTGWSGSYQCGESCETNWKCDQYGENARYRIYEQFQVCWDRDGNQCENFTQHASFSGCGCD